jgi:hypothetical protein
MENLRVFDHIQPPLEPQGLQVVQFRTPTRANGAACSAA